MRAVAIETSGRIGSIALVEQGQVLDERTFAHGLQHAAGLLPLIASACDARAWKPTDLKQIYVSIGPGSFTGLRIGVTLAKTLAFAIGAKVVAVPSVRVLVENVPADAGHAIVVLDAKRDQIFTARFERSGDGWIEREPAHVDSLAAMLQRSPRPVQLIGEGIPYHEKFIDRKDAGIVVTPADAWRATAAMVAKLGYALAEQGAFADVFTLVPLYIRKPEAEEKADAKEAAEKGTF
ncbi:MAG TPA: tRNA (adenosine(37)-N6)-threonylcarbamoyltransferase complex dimerization subunit type 1 TsaB [Tepidisphaeraceae bacterium]|jgi:tRNA threonylcarbamoyladenosine biosynthesis protein TsaB|nr:tRNA (adenosine(37)-N6)-threonylcarbamoyltransferase complex dimerization subunit type 1 TsaB [Tepidisphaeraceae bacterium]